MTPKIGICGKRIIPEGQKDLVANQIEQRIKLILADYKTTHFVGYTGIAKGSDTIFADVVGNIFKQPIQIVTPFSVNEYEKDFVGNQADLNKFNFLLNNNKNIKTVSQDIPTDNALRARAYFNLGKYIVDNCDEVIFVWDELKPGGNGGTAEVIGYYAEKKNQVDVPYILIHNEHQDELNEQLTDQYQTSNDCAIKNRNRYKLIWRSAILFGWIAVILFAISVAYRLEDIFKLIMVSMELVLVVFVFILIAVAKKKNFHGQYLKERMRAETFRILKYFYHANVCVTISPCTLEEDNVMLNIANRINTISESGYKSIWYANYVIKQLINEQRKYHSKKIKDTGKKAHYFENINVCLGVLFLLNLIFHFINTLSEHVTYSNSHQQELYSDIDKLIIFFSIFLPASYASIEALLYFQEWEILKKYSDAAHESLKLSTAELSKLISSNSEATCFEKQALALNNIGNIMVTENKNWKLILEDKCNYQFIV